MNCQTCGKELSGRQKKFCSKLCSSASRTEGRFDSCRGCGKPLVGRLKWCSASCQSTTWNREHKDNHKIHKKAWRRSEAGKESIRKYKQSPIGKEARRRNEKNNPETRKAIRARYRETHAEEIKKAKALYNKLNPERKAIEKQRRRTAKKLAPVNFTKADWRAALEYFDNKCAYCGDPLDVPHREHFIALSNGGGFTKDNIVPACGRCNSRKGNKNPLDWLVMQAHGLVAYLRVKQYLDV